MREEFDLADSAAPQLNVVALDVYIFRSAVGVDLSLGGLNVAHGREVQISTPDKSFVRSHEPLRCFEVASDRVRFDHRGSFPSLADRAVVSFSRAGRYRRRRRVRIGPKSQIRSENVSVLRPLRHHRYQVPCETREQWLRPAVRDRGGFLVEKKDQIHVAGIVEFARPKFAHAQHDQTGADIGVRLIVCIQFPLVALFAQEQSATGVQSCGRKVGQCSCRLHDVPNRRDVGERDSECQIALRPSEALHQRAPGVALQLRHIAGVRKNGRGRFIRSFFNQARGEFDIAEKAMAQERAVPEYRLEQRARYVIRSVLRCLILQALIVA